MTHILIVGNSDTPRAGFLELLLVQLKPRPKLYGYRSVKEAPDETGRAPIYIYPAEGPKVQGKDNLLGWCKEKSAESYPEIFEKYACLIESARPDGLLILDEIGPMESRSPRFCAAVLKALDGDIPVLASVRDKDTPFLRAVREHKKVQCFDLNRESGGKLFPIAMDLLLKQLGR